MHHENAAWGKVSLGWGQEGAPRELDMGKSIMGVGGGGCIKRMEVSEG